MKAEMFGTKKSAKPLSTLFSLPIYKAGSADSRTYPFNVLLN